MKWAFSFFLAISFVFLTVFGVNCIYGMMFPIKFQTEISTACEKYNVSKAVVFAVINTESNFKKEAKSSKGAVGLMQIMPSTAEGLFGENLTEEKLQEPEVNILLGTKYLSQLIARFEEVETAVAAYNAGPTNVSKWLKDVELSDDGKTLKKIPFEETRGYVEKFQKNFKYYSFKLR